MTIDWPEDRVTLGDLLVAAQKTERETGNPVALELGALRSNYLNRMMLRDSVGDPEC